MGAIWAFYERASDGLFRIGELFVEELCPRPFVLLAARANNGSLLEMRPRKEGKPLSV